MIYVGHFSCGDIVMEREGDPWHGLFTVVVEARNIATAVRTLKRFVKTFAARHDFFDRVMDIYLDACVEITRVPKSGVLTYVTLREGEDFGGISSVLLGASPETCSQGRRGSSLIRGWEQGRTTSVPFPTRSTSRPEAFPRQELPPVPIGSPGSTSSPA